MLRQTGKFFALVTVTLMLLAGSALARGHHDLNGNWNLIPTRSNFAGQDTIQTGTITINDREHNITISRNFNFEGTPQDFSYSLSSDGRENSTIRNGKSFMTKAGWEGDTLRVKTTQDGRVTVERFTLNPDGTMTLVVERPDHNVITLLFERK